MSSIEIDNFNLVNNTKRKCDDDTEFLSTSKTKIRKKNTPMGDWFHEIFTFNHLMFMIWQFFEFPQVLTLAAVHSSWRKRLFPNHYLSQSVLSNLSGAILYDTTVKTKRRSKQSRKKLGKKLWQYQTEAKLFVPNDRPNTSITNMNALYSNQVNTLVLSPVNIPSKLPNYRFIPLFRQLFTCYNKISTIQIKNLNNDSLFEKIYRLLNIWTDLRCHEVQQRVILSHCDIYKLNFNTLPNIKEVILEDSYCHAPLQTFLYTFLWIESIKHLTIKCPQFSNRRAGFFINNVGFHNPRNELETLEIQSSDWLNYQGKDKIPSIKLAKFAKLHRLILKGASRVNQIELNIENFGSHLKEIYYDKFIILGEQSRDYLIQKQVQLIRLQ